MNIASLVPILLSGAALTAQTVHVVDSAGGGQFTDLNAAAAAAANGDTLLVRSGSYGRFASPNKTLSIIADPTATVSGITIDNLSATNSILIRGMTPIPEFPLGGIAVNLSNCAGPIWFEDCTIDASPLLLVPFIGAVRVSGCAAVTFADCRLIGAASATFSPLSSPGLHATNSNVQLLDCRVTGGAGALGGPSVPPTDGEPGILVNGSSVYCQGCQVTGGAGGGTIGTAQCPNARNGGPGIRLLASSQVRVRGTSITGGAAGTVLPPHPGCSSGTRGPQFDAISGTITQFSGAPIKLGLASPVRELGMTTIEVTGPAGHLVWLWLAQNQAPPLSLPIGEGPVLIELGSLVGIPLGAIPANRTLRIQSTVSPLAAGVDVLEWFAQIVAVDPNGPTALAGTARSLTILDSRF